MWFSFCRKEEPRSKRFVKRLITGLIIGGAIGSVVGKKLLDEHDEDDEEK